MKIAESIIEELWFNDTDDNRSTEEATGSFAAALGAHGLRSFPAVAQKALDLFSNPKHRMAQVCGTIEEDPTLATGILRVANSAFYAGTQPLSDIQQSIVRLGMRQVEDIIYSVAAMDMFPDVSGLGRRVRDHCAGTAAIVRFLARELCPKHVDGIYICGLLHDIGKLLLIESEEIIYPADNMTELMTPDTIHLLERSAIGYDHAVLAGHVIAGWNMDERVSRVVAWHHQTTRAYADADVGPMVALVRTADRIDFQLSLEEEHYEPFIESIGKSTESTMIDLSASWLMDHWTVLYRLRKDALSVFV